MQIKKIKIKFNNEAETNILKNESFTKMEVTYKSTNKGGDNEVLMTSKDLPTPEYMDEWNKLAKHATTICELESKSEDIRVTGVSISIKDEEMKVGLISHKKIEASNSPLNLNAPQITEESMPDGLQDLVEKLMDMTKKYIKGERAQQTLFDDPDEEE